jgi:hypothetical protein
MCLERSLLKYGRAQKMHTQSDVQNICLLVNNLLIYLRFNLVSVDNIDNIFYYRLSTDIFKVQPKDTNYLRRFLHVEMCI